MIGVDDPDFGKRLRAYVVRSNGGTLDEDAVRDYVKSNLARYKVPREIVFMDALPRNPAGKVVKRELPDTDADRRGRLTHPASAATMSAVTASSAWFASITLSSPRSR